MPTIITYNGENPFLFDGEQYSPYIGQDIQINQLDQRLNSLETYVITGEVYNCDGFDKLLEYQQQIIEKFGTDFRTLSIEESGEQIWKRDFCKIISINFPQNRYSSILPFSITLESYSKDFFKLNYHIINPSDSWSFQENKNKTLNTTRTISAKGLRDNKSAIENAKNFVLAQKEINKISATFICQEYNLCLQSVSESINRFTGEYSLTENYISDINKKSDHILRYSVSQNKGENGIEEVSISGQIQGCKNSDFQNVRNFYKTLNIFSLAYKDYSVDGDKYLNPNPVVESVSENEKDRIIDFSYSFDNLNESNINIKLSVSIDESIDSISATVIGEISAKQKHNVTWQQIKSKYDSFNAFPFAQQVFDSYVSFFNNKGTLYSSISTKTKTEKQFNKTISFSYTYTNNLTNEDGIFKNFSSKISITPALNKFSEKVFIDSKIGIMNLGYYNRVVLSISGSATAKKGKESSAKAAIESKLQNLFLKFGKTNKSVVESKNIDSSFDLKNWSFSASWSFENSLITDSNYKTLNVSAYV